MTKCFYVHFGLQRMSSGLNVEPGIAVLHLVAADCIPLLDLHFNKLLAGGVSFVSWLS